MKPSLAYSTEIASQNMKFSSINNMKNQPKKMDGVLNHVMINECPYKSTTTHSNCTKLSLADVGSHIIKGFFWG
jgi:hypothetical protein